MSYHTTILEQIRKWTASACLLVVFLGLGLLFMPQSFAADATTVLPTLDSAGETCSSASTPATCIELRNLIEKGNTCPGSFLGKKIQCGRMTLEDVPFIVKGVMEFFFNIIGTLGVLAMMRAGLMFMLSKDKDSTAGIKAVQSALVGLVVALSSFTIARVLAFILVNNA